MSVDQPASDNRELAAGKRVLLGVTGGIAVYKALDVIGRLIDENIETRVVMTKAAENMVSALTFQARSGHPVFTDMWSPASSQQIEHIEYARWADLLLVAPLTAHTAAKFAHGMADDPLSTLYLAYEGPVVTAPAMNVVMWRHPATQANFMTLKKRGVEILDPEEGRLACGEIGVGKMAPVERIVEAALLAMTRTRELCERHVLITAGPTREYLDPVRYITNRSSGKMGYALAGEALRRGARVTLISGPVTLPAPAGVALKQVVTAREMQEAAAAEIGAADIAIFCAAVGDFTPETVSRGKIKKSGKGLTLKLISTPDIAFETSRKVRPGQLRVGFAAETENLERNAQAKLEKKKLDFIAANDVSDSRIGFESDLNQIVLIGADGRRNAFEIMSKRAVAQRLFDVFVEAWRAKAGHIKS